VLTALSAKIDELTKANEAAPAANHTARPLALSTDNLLRTDC
jgi:hypothetical protein